MITRGNRVNKMSNTVKDILLMEKQERRKLANVPDQEKKRLIRDRRGNMHIDKECENINDFIEHKKRGIRYRVNYFVKVTLESDTKKKETFVCQGIDISSVGILLKISDIKWKKKICENQIIGLQFEILPGSMPEGYEMKVRMKGEVTRVTFSEEEKCLLVGVQFEKELSVYSNEKKGRYTLFVSTLLLLCISAFIVLMRAESVIYFKFNKWLYLYSIIAAGFLLSRYLFSLFYKPVPIDVDYTPGVSVIIPCFNEEEWIRKTILSCIDQDYPVDKLEVIVVDDCSTDGSVSKIQETMEELYQDGKRFDVKNRLKCIVQHKNAGKRDALVLGVEAAKHDLVVFVDSDSFLDSFAIRNLVQPFKDPKMGGCAGRTDVANTYTNMLTKLQAVRYYIAFRVMKAAEGYFDTVTCLSGPLACYRKEIILKNKEAWLNQSFLGQKATFGDDRSMTNFVLKDYRTTYQDTAVCSTIVPNKHDVFLKQQMRWKRSWLRESLIAGKFMWKKEPFAAISFYIGLVVPVAAPIVVLYNLVYVPIVQRIFPLTFLVGLGLMALMMSAAQLFLRKSSTWLYGMVFCLYYEMVLLWQMPIAWVTFWKSTWGTRMTPSDILAQKKKKRLLEKGKVIDENDEKNENRRESFNVESGELGLKKVGKESMPEVVRTEGFSVITAKGTFYLENDSTLSPETGMHKKDTEQIVAMESVVYAKQIEELELDMQSALAASVGEIMDEKPMGALEVDLTETVQGQQTNVVHKEMITKEMITKEMINNEMINKEIVQTENVYKENRYKENGYEANTHKESTKKTISEIIAYKTEEAVAEISEMIAEEIKNSLMQQLETTLKTQIMNHVMGELQNTVHLRVQECVNSEVSNVLQQESVLKEGA